MLDPRDTDTRRLVAGLGVFAVVMFGFGYLLVPMYDLFCELTGRSTGFGEAQAAVAEAPQDRTVTVEFVTSVPPGSQWEFAPATRSMEVQPGRMYAVNFRARNPGEATSARMVMSVAPLIAAKHVRKTECFCFTEQPFAAGEAREMPMVFMLDPALADDVEQVTLAYTFYSGAAVAAAAP